MTLFDTTRLQGSNLYLVGMMGAGKTTTGKLLAKQLGYQFFDTDHLIEQVAQTAIPKIFQQSGEAGFRQLETQVLAQLSSFVQLVVATGGGIVTQPFNWSYLQQGVVIWLDASLETLEQRLAADQEAAQRPLLQGQNWQERLQELLQQRDALYSQADLRVSVNSEDTADAIAKKVLVQLAETIRTERQRLGSD